VLGALLTATFLFLGARRQTQEDSQGALQRGMKAYQQGDFTAAIESFEAVLSGQPDNVQARFNLARALHQTGNSERALEEILKLEGKMKDRGRYLSTLGQIYAAGGRLAEAQEALTESVELRPGVARTQYWLGEVLASRGAQLEAIEKIQEAARLQPQWALPHRRIGEIWLQLGAPGRAIESLERAAELAPDASPILGLLGKAYALGGRHEDSVRAFEKVLELTPEVTLVRSLLADSLLASGKVERAVTEYRRTVEQDPENTRYRIELAEALYLHEQLEAALRELEQVRVQEPQNGLVLYYIGVIEDERGQKSVARERLEAAVAVLESQPATMDFRAGRGGESYPLRIVAQVKLAELLSEVQEHEAAAESLEAVIRAEPDHATAHYLLGLAYRALGKRDEARRELNLFKQINDAREHDQAAIIFLQQGDEQQAMEELQEALRVYPADSVAHRRIARLWAKRGDPAAAMRHMELAIEARPSFVEAYTELMRLYCRYGHGERARALLERARKDGLVVPGVCIEAEQSPSTGG
jgi:pentatricopeptide repeat protein